MRASTRNTASSSANETRTEEILRKLIGFLPAGFWLFLFLYAGLFGEDLNPDGVTWSIANIPWNVRIYLGLAICSGVLLCFRKTVLPGLIMGVLPSVHLLISQFTLPVCSILFYALYAVCYYWIRS